MVQLTARPRAPQESQGVHVMTASRDDRKVSKVGGAGGCRARAACDFALEPAGCSLWKLTNTFGLFAIGYNCKPKSM